MIGLPGLRLSDADVDLFRETRAGGLTSTFLRLAFCVAGHPATENLPYGTIRISFCVRGSTSK
jgi:hypothetical protein